MSSYAKDELPTDGIAALRPLGEKDHPNAYKLKQAHEAFQKQDLDTVFSIFAEDMTWIVPGRNLMSGTFKGREGVLESFGNLFRETDAYWAHPLDYFGSDSHAALVAHVRAKRKGKMLDCQEILLFRIDAEGRFSHCWHLALDEEAWHDFFTD